MNDIDRINKLKDELCELPLNVIETIFNEIRIKKQKEERDKQRKVICYEKLIFLLSNFIEEAQAYKNRLSLFEMIGCDIDNMDEIYNQMTVGKLHELRQKSGNRLPLKLRSISSEHNQELSEWYAQFGITAYSQYCSPDVIKLHNRYIDELQYYCRKFGAKAIEPQYSKIIINTLKTKKLIPREKEDLDIINDMRVMISGSI